MSDELEKKIAQRLSLWKKSLDVPVSKLCTEKKIARRTFDRWLTGKNIPTLEQISKLQVSADFLIYGKIYPVLPYFALNIDDTTREFLIQSYSSLLYFFNQNIRGTFLLEILQSFDTQEPSYLNTMLDCYGIEFFKFWKTFCFFQNCLFSLYFSLFTATAPIIDNLIIFKLFSIKFLLNSEPVVSIFQNIFDISINPKQEEVILKKFKDDIDFFDSVLSDKGKLEFRTIVAQYIFAIKRRELPLFCPSHLTFYFQTCPVCLETSK